MPDFCLPNFKCIKSTRKPTCVCPEGFIIEEGENGTAKKCVGKFPGVLGYFQRLRPFTGHIIM